MQARAVRKHIRNTPRKMRRVVDQVRGRNVSEALNLLHFLPHRAARPIEKTIQSAVYNLIDQNPDERLDERDVSIQEIYVDQAPMFKRFQPAARGRAHPIEKRNSHLTVVVGTPDGEQDDEG